MEFHELLFGRLKTKVHTQPLVPGRRGDLLRLWATFHRGKSESVSHGKSRPGVRQAHKLPEESFPDLSVWASQVSPPKGYGRGESEHLLLLTKKQPTFMLITSLVMCVGFRVFTEQVGVPGPLVYLSL